MIVCTASGVCFTEVNITIPKTRVNSARKRYEIAELGANSRRLASFAIPTEKRTWRAQGLTCPTQTHVLKSRTIYIEFWGQIWKSLKIPEHREKHRIDSKQKPIPISSWLPWNPTNGTVIPYLPAIFKNSANGNTCLAKTRQKHQQPIAPQTGKKVKWAN